MQICQTLDTIRYVSCLAYLNWFHSYIFNIEQFEFHTMKSLETILV